MKINMPPQIPKKLYDILRFILTDGTVQIFQIQNCLS